MPHPVTPIRQALARLIRVARTLAGPRRRAAPHRALHPAHPRLTIPRLARTAAWVAALARTLAGDRYYHHPIAFPRFPGRFPSLTADLRAECGLPPLPPPTEASRAASRLHYMRRVFATVPTGTIAARLARRLGLTPAHPAWPDVLVAIATPPARTALAARPGRRPRHSFSPPTLPRLPPLRTYASQRPPRRVPPAPA